MNTYLTLGLVVTITLDAVGDQRDALVLEVEGIASALPVEQMLLDLLIDEAVGVLLARIRLLGQILRYVEGTDEHHVTLHLPKRRVRNPSGVLRDDSRLSYIRAHGSPSLRADSVSRIDVLEAPYPRRSQQPYSTRRRACNE